MSASREGRDRNSPCASALTCTGWRDWRHPFRDMDGASTRAPDAEASDAFRAATHAQSPRVRAAGRGGANAAQLCRRFRISRKAGGKWLGCKLRRRLPNQGQAPPAASTIIAVLPRHAVPHRPDAPSRPFVHFEHPRLNALWRMDVKDGFAHASGCCHPPTMLDDHGHFAVGLCRRGDGRGAASADRGLPALRSAGTDQPAPRHPVASGPALHAADRMAAAPAREDQPQPAAAVPDAASSSKPPYRGRREENTSW